MRQLFFLFTLLTLSVQSYAQNISSKSKSPEDLKKYADSLKRIGKYSQAAAVYRRAADSLALQKEFSDYARRKADETGCFRRMHLYDSALQINLKAEQYLTGKIEEYDLGLARLIYERAIVFQKTAYHQKAIEAFDFTLRSNSDKLGEKHISISKILNSKATSLTELSRFGAAENCYKKALSIAGSLNPPKLSTLSSIHNNYRALYLKSGKYNEAVEHADKALAYSIEAYGESHISVAGSYRNIGNIFLLTGQKDKAINYYYKSNAVANTLPQDMSLFIAGNELNMANVYKHAGDFGEALSNLKHALQVYEKKLGPKHPKTAEVTAGIADVYNRLKEYDKAMVHFRKSLEIFKSRYGTKGLKVPKLLSNMGYHFLQRKQFDSARHYLTESLRIYTENNISRGRPKSITCKRLSYLYYDLNIMDSASFFAQESCKALSYDFNSNRLTDNPTPDNAFDRYSLAQILNQKSHCLVHMNMYKEAENALETADQCLSEAFHEVKNEDDKLNFVKGAYSIRSDMALLQYVMFAEQKKKQTRRKH